METLHNHCIKYNKSEVKSLDKKISVMIDRDLLKEVDKKAKESLRSRSKFIEFVLREYLKNEK